MRLTLQDDRDTETLQITDMLVSAHVAMLGQEEAMWVGRITEVERTRWINDG